MPDIDEDKTTEDLKLINDMNLRALAEDFARAMSQHVGGTFEITVKRFEQTRSSFVNEFEIALVVRDESSLDRYKQSKPGRAR